jgi:hypothetical protein
MMPLAERLPRARAKPLIRRHKRCKHNQEEVGDDGGVYGGEEGSGGVGGDDCADDEPWRLPSDRLGVATVGNRNSRKSFADGLANASKRPFAVLRSAR